MLFTVMDVDCAYELFHAMQFIGLTFITCLIYCRYGVKIDPINQSDDHQNCAISNTRPIFIRPSLTGIIMVQRRPSVRLSGHCRPNHQLQDFKTWSVQTMQDLFTQTYISDISQFLQELDIYNKILRCFHLIILDFFIPRRNMAEILPIRRKTLSNQSINLKLVHLASMIRGRCQLFFKVGGQRSSFYCHIVGKRCRQDTV